MVIDSAVPAICGKGGLVIDVAEKKLDEVIGKVA